MRNRLKLFKDDSGVTAIEFALIAPVMFLIIFAIVEVGLMYLTDAVLQGSMALSKDDIKKLAVQGNADPTAAMRDVLNDRSGGFLNTSSIGVGITSYATFADIGQQECVNGAVPPACSTGVQQGPGTSGSIIIFTASYPWLLFTPMMKHIFDNTNGVVNLTSSIIFRNEPNP